MNVLLFLSEQENVHPYGRCEWTFSKKSATENRYGNPEIGTFSQNMDFFFFLIDFFLKFKLEPYNLKSGTNAFDAWVPCVVNLGRAVMFCC